MKNSNVRNLILIIGGLFFISFLFSLSFTFVVNKEQKNAIEYAESFQYIISSQQNYSDKIKMQLELKYNFYFN